jgi:hypothetical protein
MRTFALVLAIGAATVLGSVTAEATEARPGPGATTRVSEAIDMSARHRGWRHRGWHHGHHVWHSPWRYHWRPYRIYGYRPVYYRPTFGFPPRYYSSYAYRQAPLMGIGF